MAGRSARTHTHTHTHPTSVSSLPSLPFFVVWSRCDETWTQHIRTIIRRLAWRGNSGSSSTSAALTHTPHERTRKKNHCTSFSCKSISPPIDYLRTATIDYSLPALDKSTGLQGDGQRREAKDESMKRLIVSIGTLCFSHENAEVQNNQSQFIVRSLAQYDVIAVREPIVA